MTVPTIIHGIVSSALPATAPATADQRSPRVARSTWVSFGVTLVGLVVLATIAMGDAVLAVRQTACIALAPFRAVGSLDAFLLTTKPRNLPPEALVLKRRILRAQAKKAAA